MKKLLETGKTDLLQRFISKKGRPFSAYLVRGADGKVGFEFEERKPRAGAKKASPGEAAPEKTTAKSAAKKMATKKPAARSRKPTGA
jgi:DNA topoisomerase-3